LEKALSFYSRDANFKKTSTAGICPFLPFDDDFETSAIFNRANIIETLTTGFGTKLRF
jgi:hypothetical protein